MTITCLCSCWGAGAAWKWQFFWKWSPCISRGSRQFHAPARLKGASELEVTPRLVVPNAINMFRNLHCNGSRRSDHTFTPGFDERVQAMSRGGLGARLMSDRCKSLSADYWCHRHQPFGVLLFTTDNHPNNCFSCCVSISTGRNCKSHATTFCQSCIRYV